MCNQNYPRLNEIIKFLEKFFPKETAYDGDNIGLQIGNDHRVVKKIMLALDATVDVINEAVNNGIDLLIVHHPLIYKPLYSLSSNMEIGKKIESLIKSNIALYVMHTNLDFSYQGINDYLANIFNLKKVKPLKKLQNNIDGYDYSSKSGIGRVGYLENEMKISDFIEIAKKNLELECVRFIGNDVCSSISKIAISSGSGNDFIKLANASKADFYISGDITYHYAQEALELGINVLDVGHAVEDVSKYILNEKLLILKKESEFDFEITLYNQKIDPYTFF